MRKVFLDNLPLLGGGKKLISWKDSINHKVKFIYDNIEGYIEITKYEKGYLYVNYLNNIDFKIKTSNFMNCCIGTLICKITKEFKIEIGERIVDDKRDIVIVDKKYMFKQYTNKGKKYIKKHKYYQYHCNKCGFNSDDSSNTWLLESNLKRGSGCQHCSNYHNQYSKFGKVIQGINDIPTTEPWMVKYFQGGYDEAKLYTKTGGGNPNNPKGYINPVCPYCGRAKEKKIHINSIYRYRTISCSKCGDGFSYPNKFAFNLLEQLNLDFISEYSPEWIKPRAYDFYFKLNNKEYILEMDGGWHYKDNYMNKGNTKKESKEIDNYKDEQANFHGIEVIRIDCNYESNDRFEYIKQNILNSKLNKLFNFASINWDNVELFSLSSLIKKTCDVWNSGVRNIDEITEKLKLSSSTIRNYLKKGSKIQLCNYKPNLKGSSKCYQTLCMTTGKLFSSVSEIERVSEEIFGVKLLNSMLSETCNGKHKSYKGFKFKYIKDLTLEEYIKYDIENKLKELHNRELVQAS